MIQHEDNYSVIYVEEGSSPEDLCALIFKEIESTEQYFWVLDYSGVSHLNQETINYLDERLISLRDRKGLGVVVDPSAANDDTPYTSIEFLPTVEESADFIFMVQLEQELEE